MKGTLFKIVQEGIPWLRRLLRRPATDCKDACLNSSLSCNIQQESIRITDAQTDDTRVTNKPYSLK